MYRNKGSKDNIVISLSGAHGIGKSTIYRLLRKNVDEDLKFKFFPERYVKNPPFPFGSTNKQTAFRSELHFLQQLIKRNRSVTNYDEKYNGRIIVMDRTPLCVLVYSKSLNLREKDYQLILDTYKSIKWREDHIIYLNAEPDAILRRIHHRGSLDKRREEWNEYERTYLVNILTFYKQFLLSDKDNVRVLDTDNQTPQQTLEKVQAIIEELTGYSFEKVYKKPKSQMDITKFL